jgi:hypothetical protein
MDRSVGIGAGFLLRGFHDRFAAFFGFGSESDFSSMDAEDKALGVRVTAVPFFFESERSSLSSSCSTGVIGVLATGWS